MATTNGVTFDLGLPDGSLAVFRYDNAAVVEMERECGEMPLMTQIGTGQWTRPVAIMLWAGRLHQERWTLPRAIACMDRYEMRAAGEPPARPAGGGKEARQKYRAAMKAWNDARGEAMETLRIALGDAMVAGGVWNVNVFDPDALEEEQAALTSGVEVTGQPEDVSGVEVIDSPPAKKGPALRKSG